MSVFVLDKRKRPLMPCSEKRARLLLERGRAVVHRRVPFVIRLKDRVLECSELQQLRACIDPGSKVTGMALVRGDETKDGGRKRAALGLFEIIHRGHVIRRAMEQRRSFRRTRRSRNLKYRAPRFNNRRRQEGWLAPSLQHRVDAVMTWVNRFMRWAPVNAVSMELVRFDMQKLESPEISGVEYQQGELAGYEVREYLLEKWGRKCVYCDAENVPLEIEHIVPRSRGGGNRVSNLTLACRGCNQSKGNMDVREFLSGDTGRLARVLAFAKRTLRDAAAVNSTRWSLFNALKNTGMPVETGSGGRTKWNRRRLGIPKTHALDAVCVGDVDAVIDWQQPTLSAQCTGRGAYKRTQLTKYGFPRGFLMRSKSVRGFQTGDMVRAHVESGKNAGVHVGRVAVRASGSFNIRTQDGLIQGVHARFCSLLQRSDGYSYAFRSA